MQEQARAPAALFLPFLEPGQRPQLSTADTRTHTTHTTSAHGLHAHRTQPRQTQGDNTHPCSTPPEDRTPATATPWPFTAVSMVPRAAHGASPLAARLHITVTWNGATPHTHRHTDTHTHMASKGSPQRLLSSRSSPRLFVEEKPHPIILAKSQFPYALFILQVVNT